MGGQSPTRSQGGVFCRWTLRVLPILLLIAHASPLRAESEDERRVKAGARLFRAMLSADVDIEKKADDDGALTVLIVRSDRDSFEDVAQGIVTPSVEEGGASVHGLPLRSRIVSVEALQTKSPARYAGVFLAGRLDSAALKEVIDWAAGRGVIAFSPFEGDVEQGIPGGLSIEARVKPYVNGPALARAGVQLKEKFMKVAKTYQ